MVVGFNNIVIIRRLLYSVFQCCYWLCCHTGVHVLTYRFPSYIIFSLSFMSQLYVM